ncbi:MAG: family 16 glycoside hydrolase [Mariniblastus sp.]
MTFKILSSFATVFLFTATSIFLTSNLNSQENSAAIEPGYESLFNGKDLTGWNYLPTTEQQKKGRANWQKNDPNAPPWPLVESIVDFTGLTQTTDGRFVAENGNLVVTVPAEGRKVQMLYTTREFSGDFILKLDFRAAENADSGVFIRGKQLQCRDYPNAGPYKKLKKFKPGDWNELVVVVTGNTARCTCNGEVLEESFKLPKKGPIGVEGDNGKIEYRRIRLADGKLKPTHKTESWTFEQFENGKGSIKADGDAITFETTTSGDENWHVQAYQAGLNLEEGATYKVTFEIKSSDSNTVLVTAQINEEDWHNIGLQEEIFAGKDFESHEFTFTATDVVKNKNRIGFVLGDSVGSVSVKNLKLSKE